MHNGKFFSGLPPKMIDRSNSCVKNRQESHFFWPDDTHIESAIDTRVRRRESLNFCNNEKPILQKNIKTLSDSTDNVDAKKRLQKEFTKSSIQFFDKILEEEREKSATKPYTTQGITSKPTATKLELPKKTITDIDTAAHKKKEVFDSNVEFYDFMNEDNLNNKIIKYDFNDKKHVERNTKNSPKVQVKHNVNNYLRDELTPEREINLNENSLYYKNNQCSTSEFKGNSAFNSTYFVPEQYSSQSPPKSTEQNRRDNIYRQDQKSKLIPKNCIRNNPNYDSYMDNDDEYLNETSAQISKKIKQMSIDNNGRQNGKKRVTYYDQEENILENNKYDDQQYHDEVDVQNTKTKNRNYNRENRNQEQHQRFKQRSISPKNEYQFQYMATKNINSKNNKTNNMKNCEFNNEIRRSNNSNEKIDWDTENFAKAVKQKHLRSSICFHGGEIVANDSPPAQNIMNSKTSHPRNARNAAIKRVSVGLPD